MSLRLRPRGTGHTTTRSNDHPHPSRHVHTHVRNAAIATALAVVAASGAAAIAAEDPASTAHLAAVGPTSSLDGFPVWYKDKSNPALRLEPCLTVGDPMCAAGPDEIPDPEKPLSFPDNFPEEFFYMLGNAEINTPAGGQAKMILGLEGAFANGVHPGEQIVFGRIRMFARDLVPGGHYIVTHPYGVDEGVAEDDGQLRLNEDVGVAPGVFTGALNSRIGPFLQWTDNAAPAGYIGDPNVDHAVTGSPFGTNFFRIERVDGDGNPIESFQTDLFSLQGKKATNSGVDADRATYTPDGDRAGGTIDVFASSDPDATGTPSIQAKAAGVDAVTLRGSAGHFFGQLHYNGAPPASLTVTNASDNPPAVKTLDVTDGVTGEATYNGDDHQLTVTAHSTDPAAHLIVDGFGPASGSPFAADSVAHQVTVSSDQGGTVSVPVALDDAAAGLSDLLAAAGPDQHVFVNQQVTLDATGSLGDIDSYQWTQTGGPAVSLTNAGASRASFTVPSGFASDTLTFRVTVTSPGGRTSSDDVDVVVDANPNAPAPVVNVAPVPATQRGSTATVDASGSTNASSFVWTQTGGPTVTLNTDNPAKPTFTFPSFAFNPGGGSAATQAGATVQLHVVATGPGGTAAKDVTVAPANDTLAVTSTRFRTGSRELRIAGTSTQTGRVITLHLGAMTGPVLGTATVDNLGAWELRQKPASVASVTSVSIESRGGGVLDNVAVTQTN
jgi:hypothetical protein